MARTWTPIADMALRSALAESLDETVRALARIPVPPNDVDTQVGLALLFSYLHLARGHPADAERARHHLEGGIDAIASIELPAALYDGYLGVAWAVEHLRTLLYDDGDDPNDAIDDELLALLDHPISVPSYDLINGLVGIAVYAQERLPRDKPATILARVVAELESRATIDDRGTRWWTQPESLPAYQVAMAPAGYCNLGVAHGIPGVLVCLARASAAGVTDAARPLLEDGLRWFLQQREHGKSDTNFLHWVADVMPSRPVPRAAWCYGDPGIAVSLLWISRLIKHKDLEAVAVEIALSIARRDLAEIKAIDTGLCHGSIGLAHLFNRVYQATRVPEFAHSTDDWFRRGLSMRAPGTGVAGYRSWTSDRMDSHPYWKAETDLLTGAAGVALALLAATTEFEPNWDRLLLAAVPAVPEAP